MDKQREQAVQEIAAREARAWKRGVQQAMRADNPATLVNPYEAGGG